jgi:hypothetical protein
MDECQSARWSSSHILACLTLIAFGFVAGCSGGGGGSAGGPAPTYILGGTLTGLVGTGVVLQLNGGNNLSVPANESFTFPTAMASGTSYNTTVLTQPTSPAQICNVTNGSGTVTSNITDIQVNCLIIYTIGGTVSGLSGTGLVLQYNGGNNLPITANGSFTFSEAIANGGSYNVTIFSQPANSAQTCKVSNGSGTPSANVTSVQVTCLTNYTISGTVAGLSGPGLVLQDNGGDNLPLSTNGNFAFATAIVVGGSYDVTILDLPAGAATCGVSNASGTPSANVSNVEVGCIASTSPGQYEWTWQGGPSAGGVATYGTEGTAAPANIPNLRAGGVTRTDTAGNLWLFGGGGSAPPGTPTSTWGNYFFSDLWKYGASEWTWMGGPQVPNVVGVYGTQGTPAPNNAPGARVNAASWTDKSGNFWLFGGNGYDASGQFYPNFSFLDDLWEYSAGQWTWMSGSNGANSAGHGANGTYGTLGVPAPGNVPGGRTGAASWTDSAGNLWLFGGVGYGSQNEEGSFNDLWRYSGGEWTWMSGSNAPGQAAIYGTKGMPAPGDTPGAGAGDAASTDASGNLWLFDGSLWKYSAGEWTWFGGPQGAVYGTQGVPDAANFPGTRTYAAIWTDAAGNLWLFGGYGYDSNNAQGNLNDLWKYSAGEWTWMGGSNVISQAATYGTKGTPAPGVNPGARAQVFAWTDASGNFWLFGGGNSDGWAAPTAPGAGGNDIWEYKP